MLICEHFISYQNWTSSYVIWHQIYYPGFTSGQKEKDLHWEYTCYAVFLFSLPNTRIAQDIFWSLNTNGFILKDSVEQLQCVKCDR